MFNLNRKTRLKIALSVCLLVVIVAVSFFPSLKNGFVNWDDDAYVTGNVFIRSFSISNIQHIFTSFFIGNYQPFTILSYLFEYCLFGPNPFNYHLTNLFLHILNAIFVFWLIYLFTKKTSVSLITALLFGIHPLHVESVAWISERKDLLYTLFFLAALICYVYYLRALKTGKYYCFSLILFVFSLLSKAMAIILPIILLNIDYFICRKWDKNKLVDKIPFFVLSFIFGILGVIAQSSSGAIRTEDLANLFNRFVTANYSIMFYLNKIFIPIKLSCCYPRLVNHLSWGLIALPGFYIIFCIIIFLFSQHKKKIIFGNVFFLICILPILQFAPIGETIVADRYMYLPVVGIFYLVAEGLVWLCQAKWRYKRIMKIIVLVFLICLTVTLSLLTQKRCKVWQDSLTLWNDVLSKYPNAIMAYNNRGMAFNSKKEYNKAILDFNHVISFVSDSDGRPIYLYLVNLYRAIGKDEKAEQLLDKVREIDAKLARQYYERGNQCKAAGKNNEAIALYGKGLELYPNNLALCNELGATYIYVGRFKEAETLFKKTLEIRPDFALIHNNLALVYFYEKNYALAIKHADRAIELGYVVVPQFLELLKPYRR
jgi:hypothetical protein